MLWAEVANIIIEEYCNIQSYYLIRGIFILVEYYCINKGVINNCITSIITI